MITIPTKNENFDIKKWFQILFFSQASSDYKKIVTQWFYKKLNNHKVFNKYICLLMSIQKQLWLSRLLLCHQLPNRRETVSLPCGSGGDPLHTHPKRHKFFSSTHQSLRKESNSNHCILSLERGPKSCNLKGCNQVISVLNKSVLQLLLQEGLHLIGTIRWSTILHECEIFVQIHCFNSRD